MVPMIFSGSGSYRKDTYDCDEYEATEYFFRPFSSNTSLFSTSLIYRGGLIAFQILEDMVFVADKEIHST